MHWIAHTTVIDDAAVYQTNMLSWLLLMYSHWAHLGSPRSIRTPFPLNIIFSFLSIGRPPKIVSLQTGVYVPNVLRRRSYGLSFS